MLVFVLFFCFSLFVSFCFFDYLVFFCSFFISLFDFFFFFDPFLFRYSCYNWESIYFDCFGEYLLFSLSFMCNDPVVLHYGIDWVLTVESGMVMPCDKDFYVYYYGFWLNSNVDWVIFVFFVSQSVFFFGAAWFPFFFHWILALSPLVVIFRSVMDILSGRIIKFELIDEMFVWTEEDFEDYATITRDADYDNSGGLLARDLIIDRIDSEFLEESKRIMSEEEEEEERVGTSTLELQREMVRKFREYRELLFGYNLFGEKYGFSFIWENFEEDEDTCELLVCCLPSDINYYSSFGDIFVDMDYRFYKSRVVFEIDRILVRDIFVGFNLFFFKYQLFDFFEDTKEKEMFFRELQSEGFDAAKLKRPDWLTFIFYRSKLFFLDSIYNIYLHGWFLVGILEFLFYFSVWVYITYISFFFAPFIYTFGPRFWVYSWTFWKVCLLFVVFLLVCYLFFFIFVRRFHIFRSVLLKFMSFFSVFYYVVCLFWNYLVFVCLFFTNYIIFRKLVFSKKVGLNRQVLMSIAFDLKLNSASLLFLVHLSSLWRWLHLNWMFDYVTWLRLLYSWYVYLSFGCCSTVLFSNYSKLEKFFLVRHSFPFIQSMNNFAFFKFYHCDFFFLDFDLVNYFITFLK